MNGAVRFFAPVLWILLLLNFALAVLNALAGNLEGAAYGMWGTSAAGVLLLVLEWLR